MMFTQILFRGALAEDGERKICAETFGSNFKEHRIKCHNAMVICRYSCLPYYKELEEDLLMNDCRMINSYKQHEWIAQYKYYDILKHFMSRTWTDEDIYKADPHTSFMVKGKTNSRKTSWKHLFADSRSNAVLLAAELKQDSLIGSQDIIYREYVELENFGYDCTGIPIANEWRIFCLFDKILTYGYYWSNFPEVQPEVPPQVLQLANELTKIVCDHTNFYVLDIAVKKDGNPILIEINDGQMSGLSNCCPKALYKRLYDETKYVRWDRV